MKTYTTQRLSNNIFATEISAETLLKRLITLDCVETDLPD